MNILLRKIRSFISLPWSIKFLLLPTWVLLAFSKMMILTVSFKRLSPLLGAHDEISTWIPILDSRHEQLALEIARVIRLASRYTPWESNCFPQAVTARLLLGLFNIPYTLFFGLARDTDTNDMKAHAWVAAGRVRVSGGESFDHYTVVGCYVAPKLAAEMERSC